MALAGPTRYPVTMRERLFIGTSGWNYDGWKHTLYKGVPRKGWLQFYARHFNAIEVNGTFYREQSPETLERWRDSTPESFSFAIKGHKYLTHNKKLLDPAVPFERQRSNAVHLGPKLRAVVWQLPGFFRKDIARLRGFAGLLATWSEVGQAVELRHASWFDAETAEVLREHGVAVCMSDAASWPMWDTVTSDLVYVRLHGHEYTYHSPYPPEQLAMWADRARGWLAEGRTVHFYFDNTDANAAPFDAMKLAENLA